MPGGGAVGIDIKMRGDVKGTESFVLLFNDLSGRWRWCGVKRGTGWGWCVLVRGEGDQVNFHQCTIFK